MSFDSDEGFSVPRRKTRSRITQRVRSSDSEEHDSEDDASTSTPSKITTPSNAKRQKCDNEDTGITPVKKLMKTPATRTSDRLRKKNARDFTLPSKEEIWEKVSPGSIKLSSNKKLRELKPRRRVNNFLKERNSYASEKVGDIYLTDDSLSDFINDEDDGEDGDGDGSDDSSSSDNKQERNKTSRKRKELDVPLSESDSDQNRKKEKRKKRNNKRKSTLRSKKKKVMDSSSEERKSDSESDTDESSGKNRENNKKKKMKRISAKRKILRSSSDSDSDSKNDEDTDTGEVATKMDSEPCSNEATVRRSSRRRELIKKDEDDRYQKYGELIESRKKLKLNQNDNLKKSRKLESDENLEVIQSLIENFSTDEEDNNFVVPDAEISEEGEASDSEVMFLKLKDDHSPDWNNEEAINNSPSKSSIKTRRRLRNSASKWKRINTRLESNSEDSDSNDKEGPSHSSELHSAVKNNDIDLVKKLLQQDPCSVDNVGYRNRSALHLAALNGNVEIVQFLLKSKADSMLKDKYGFLPITYAANGHSECLKILLKNTDIKKVHKVLLQTTSKMSLLHLAIGETRTGDEFLERGKSLELLFLHDKNACVKMLQHSDARGRTPLEAAVFASQHKCLEVLLRNGANPLSFKTDEGGNLLHFAVESASHLRGVVAEDKDSSLCLRQLVEPLNVHLNDKDSHDFTPLMYACESGNDDCLLALIEAGGSVAIKDNFGTSPLHLAAMAGSTECVQLLFSHGHPVDCVDKCGWPPLLYADFSAQEECVLALMKPKPEQLFVLGDLLKRQRNEEDKKKTFKVVKNVLISLANHDAYYTVFNDFIRVNPELLDEYNHGLLQHTWRAILDFNNKHRWFKRKLHAISGDTGWGCSSPSLMVNRSDVLGSTMRRIGNTPGHQLRLSMSVTFENEPGICTGPKREFFVCFCKDAVDQSRGLFAVTDDCQYSPVPNAYFSTFEAEVQVPIPSSSNETKQEIKDPETTNNQSDIATQEYIDLENVGIEDCTDSELLAIDLTDSAMDADNECTDSELITALDAATDSGICTTNDINSPQVNGTAQSSTNTTTTSGVTACGNQVALESSSESQESSTEQSSSATTETASSEESLVNNSESSASLRDKDTWIPCGKKGVVIAAIALRSKMKQLRLIGRLVGSAICQDMLVDLHLSKPFVKQVLGIPLSHPDDLDSFDHQLHQTLVSLVEESVDDLDLPFALTALNPWTHKPVTVNLSDDENKTLDDSNKHEYVKLVSQFKLETSIEKEVEEFRSGLNEVIPRDLLSFFTADEFSLLLNGISKIDVEDWKKNTMYHDFTSSSEVIIWFWDIVSHLKEEEKALLLKFATGSPCVPLGGFAKLRGYNGPNRFTISEHSGRRNKIPEASTCFNLLKLTDYDTKKDLREKLLIAIRHGSEGFSFG